MIGLASISLLSGLLIGNFINNIGNNNDSNTECMDDIVWTDWFDSIGVIEKIKGDWVEAKGKVECECYTLIKFKLCNRISLKNFVDKQYIIEEKLGVKRVMMVVQNGLLELKILKDEMPVKVFSLIENKNSIVLGVDIDNNYIEWDLRKDCHAIIAGVPGCGKSTLIYQIIIQCLNKKMDMYLGDLKLGVDLYDFCKCKGVMRFADDVASSKKLIEKFKIEADRRFKLFRECGEEGINEYDEYVKRFGEDSLNEAIMIIDEYADLAMEEGQVKKKRGKDKENEYIPSTLDNLILLARKCRAVGMHIVLATQRPSVDVIPGVLKSNFSCVIGFRTMNKSNSEVIIDAEGLEKLDNRQCKVILRGRLEELRTLYIDRKLKEKYIKMLS